MEPVKWVTFNSVIQREGWSPRHLRSVLGTGRELAGTGLFLSMAAFPLL